MKKLIFALMLMMAATLSVEAHRYYPTHVTISFQTFYDELSPYGEWIYAPDYGYVWRPYFDRPDAFRPYSSGGNWALTEYGWTWISDYRWGWATFHYGRWYFDDFLGWMWIPGFEWAPAWVTWGTYNDYYGWAPMGPDIYVSVNFNWFAPDPWWTFVPRRHFCSHHWRNYIYDRPVQINHITHITNVYYTDNPGMHRNDNWFYGPRVSDVERYGNTRVRTMRVVDTDRPDNLRTRDGQVDMYRPSVDRNRGESRPGEYRNAENLRSGTRITPQNPRTNDPGVNHRREAGAEPQGATNSKRNYDAIQTRPGRVEPGNNVKNEQKRNAQPVNSERGKESTDRKRTEKASNDNGPSAAGNREPAIKSDNKRSSEPSREAVKRESSDRRNAEVKRSASEERSKEKAGRSTESSKVERKQAKSDTGNKSERSRSSDKTSSRSSRSSRNR